MTAFNYIRRVERAVTETARVPGSCCEICTRAASKQALGYLWVALGGSRRFLGTGPFNWIANRFADQLADQAAKSLQPDSSRVLEVEGSTGEAAVTLRHHIEVAIHIAPGGRKSLAVQQAGVPKVSKAEKERQLARHASHKLDHKDQCVLCHISVPLEIPCLHRGSY